MADVGEAGFGMASFSSRGPSRDDRLKPEIVAPGVNISAPKANTGNTYVSYSGTSMATPFVSGTIALMLDANPDLTVQQVKDMLYQTAQDWGPAGHDNDYGWGRLDSYRAVARAGSYADSGAPPVPGHVAFSGSLGSGAEAEHSFNVTDLAYPVSVNLLMPGTGTGPDFDLYLYAPSGQEVARSAGTKRQEQVAVTPTQTGIWRAKVKSYSGAGQYNLDISAGITGSVPDPAPTVSITYPEAGATVSGAVEVTVQATDNQAVSRVEVAIDGGAFTDITSTFDGTQYRYAWNTTGVANGAHIIHARATDSVGQEAQDARAVTVQNEGPPGQQLWTRTGQVSATAPDAEFNLNVAQVGYVDFTLDWGTAADLDLYVYAPDGSLAGRAFTLNRPERLRIDTVRWGAGGYRVRVNRYSGVASSFTLTAAGYERVTHTGSVSPSGRNMTHNQAISFTGQSRITLDWPTSADLDFFVYDPSGTERTRAFTTSKPEVRDFALDVTGGWSVRVNLYSGVASAYTLQWFIPASILS